jgi:hypothetical protein
VANELTKRGLFVSPTGMRSVAQATARPPVRSLDLNQSVRSSVSYYSLRNSSRNQNPADYFYSAATNRSRGVLWPILLRRVYVLPLSH